MLDFIFSLQPNIDEEYNKMYLFLYLIDKENNLNLNDQQLVKFIKHLEKYVKLQRMEDILLKILTEKSKKNNDKDVLNLFKEYGKHPKFCEYLERLISRLLVCVVNVV